MCDVDLSRSAVVVSQCTTAVNSARYDIYFIIIIIINKLLLLLQLY